MLFSRENLFGGQPKTKIPYQQKKHLAIITSIRAGVAELVDAPDSKSGSFTGVSVRFRPSVPRIYYARQYWSIFLRNLSRGHSDDI